MPSGRDIHRLTTTRVSTDRKAFIIELPVSSHLLDTTNAFHEYLVEDAHAGPEEAKKMEASLFLHPKSIAQKRSAARARKQTSTTGGILKNEQRIPLPREVQHDYVSDENDNIFSGQRFVEYKNGEVHLHVELQAYMKDSYKPATRSTQPFFSPNRRRNPEWSSRKPSCETVFEHNNDDEYTYNTVSNMEKDVDEEDCYQKKSPPLQSRRSHELPALTEPTYDPEEFNRRVKAEVESRTNEILKKHKEDFFNQMKSAMG